MGSIDYSGSAFYYKFNSLADEHVKKVHVFEAGPAKLAQ